jgi:putative ABC transport system permease protein
MRRHRLRSGLTATGVAVGVATVIALMTLGSSFEAYFVNQYNSTFATNAFTVQPQTNDLAVQMASAAAPLYIFPGPIFSQRDVTQIERLSTVQSVIPYSTSWPGKSIQVNGANFSTNYGIGVLTISPQIFTQGFLKLSSGAVANGTSQVLVGSSIALSIAYEQGSTNDTSFAVGRQITMLHDGSRQTFTITGVLKESPVDTTLNDMVYVPLTQQPSSNASSIYNGIAVIAKDSNFDKAESATIQYLNTESDGLNTLKSTGEGLEFQPASSTGASSFLQEQVSEYTTIILAMGVVALFGGAVGVSNIMLVSVTERTREIGTLKAMGGSRLDIVQAFLFEAILVSLTGVVFGLIGGAALGYALTRLPMLGLQLPLVYNMVWFPISAAIGLTTGLVAGVYPALKAAGVLPVRALSYE